MKGTLQDFSVAENRGWIAADDGNRYAFQGPEWKGSGFPMSGNRVEFELLGDAAISVQPEVNPSVTPVPQQAGGTPGFGTATTGNKPDKTTVGICAILLGWLGIHKFLLGFQTEGIIMLAVSLGAGVITCGIGSAVIWIIGVIEGVIYITMSDEDFDRTYIQGKKKWF